MDNEAVERKRGRTFELKGEGQGFTLRGYLSNCTKENSNTGH